MNLSDLRHICDEALPAVTYGVEIDADDFEAYRKFRATFDDPELVGLMLDCAEAECNCSLDECWGDCPQLLAKHRLDAYLKDVQP